LKGYFSFPKVNIQADYQQKTPAITLDGTGVEDDDFIPPEPPARTDYGKKALVSKEKLENSKSQKVLGTKPS
jgi:hypothetical protein